MAGRKNPVFRQFSEYIDHLHGREGYYRGYRWGLPVFRGLDGPDQPSRQKREDLSFAQNRLPSSRMFGKDYFGQAFIRSGWQNHDTFISFRAGDTFTHHGHYKAGHFTLYKHAPLAIYSGTYTGYTTEQRLNYYIRTVSSNAILIMSPDECQQPNKFFNTCVSAIILNSFPFKPGNISIFFAEFYADKIDFCSGVFFNYCPAL